MPSPQGDCIDCRKCVTTCPTGIDIREGLQMECIGCAQCIDACDDVMDRIGRPRGLIRYSSQAAMAGGTRKTLRPRVVIYPAILLAVAIAFVTVLLTTQSANVLVLRGLGRPFMQLPSGEIANQLRIKITNRANQTSTFSISASGVDGLQVASQENPVTLKAGERAIVPVTITVPPQAMHSGACEIDIAVTDGAAFTHHTTYRLLGPASVAADHHEDRSR